MLRKTLDLIWLGRPHFLLGGLLLYALGGSVARAQGYPIDGRLYWLGQLALSAAQLMTHYLNDYWDVQADRINRNRTPFSGGSGVLPEGRISRGTALAVGLACLTVSLSTFFYLVARHDPGALFVSLYVLILLGAFFYTAPPVNLAASGYGEFTTSLIVAGLLPMSAYALQTRRLDFQLLLATLPLVALHFAMLLAFELPDFDSDLASGKRTLLVRLGKPRGILAHNLLIGSAIVVLAAGPLLGLPWNVALGTSIALPLAGLQWWLMRRLRRGQIILWSWITLVAVALFGLTAYLEALGFWVVAGR